MLPTVPVPPQHVDDYAEAAGPEAVDRLRQAAESLRGARVLHVNSTAFGGGVAELLFTQVALMNDLGIDTTWQVIEGAEDFFTVTKFAHNGLQGAQVPWTPDMEAIYLDRCRSNAAGLAEGYDYVVIHDPQPAGVLGVLEEEGRRAGRWIWRCHIDLSAPHRPVLDFFTRRVAGYAPGPGRLVLFLEGGYDLEALTTSVGASLAALADVPYRPEPATSGGPGAKVVEAARERRRRLNAV